LVLAELWQSYDFGFLPRCREVTESKRVIKYMGYMNKRSSWKVPEIFIWNAINTAGLS
jgi:hypothetical protein